MGAVVATSPQLPARAGGPQLMKILYLGPINMSGFRRVVAALSRHCWR